MSHYNKRTEEGYGSVRSPSRTQRVPREASIERSPVRQEGANTDRNPVIESPSKYDIQFFQRKVNRLQTDMAVLQDELSLTKFKLSKADDFQRKYQIAFQQNQDLSSQLDLKDQENAKLGRQIEQLLRKNDQSSLQIRNLQQKVNNQKRNNHQLKDSHQQFTSKISKQGKNQKSSIQQSYLRQMALLKQDFRSKQQNLKRKVLSLQRSLSSAATLQKSLKFSLQTIKHQKNTQIKRLSTLASQLSTQLSELNQTTDNKLIDVRTDLVEKTEERIQNVRKLASDIQQCLMSQVRNLNQTLSVKNHQLQFVIQADHKFMHDNQALQNGLKAHIQRLQDRIFVIQRENQVELFETIHRLQTQYQQNLNKFNDQFDNVRKTHLQEIQILKEKLHNLEKQNQLLSRQNVRVQSEHKKVATDKEDAIKMLSQKIINLESSKDIQLKNYTTSMKQIQTDAQAKLEDLHSAIEGKNTQFEILNAQLALKNQQLNALIEEINKLRNENRQKMRILETKNSTQQNSLNEYISNLKKQVQQSRRNINALQSEMSDKQAQSQLKLNLMRQDLESQKQANEILKARNKFLAEWCQQIERDLKSERVSNVNILHDTNISRRETVQTREQVRVEMEAIKDKEVQQIRNIFKLEKNRLQTDLLNREHQLREKKEELARLLAEYKKLENKVGKPSKFDRGAEEEGKCKATLNAQILLTENIFNMINRQ